MLQKAMGTTLKCGTTTVGSVRSVSQLKRGSEALDVTTLDAQGGYRRYMQGVRDAGEITVTGFFDSGDAGQTALQVLYSSGENSAFTITFSGGTAAAFTAFVRSYAFGQVEVDGAVTYECVLRISGGVTVA